MPPAAPRVTVVIPAYNAEKFLLSAAESVLGQSFRALELVIVNDGSSDGTLHVARSIADPRVMILPLTNGGPARARNAGCRERSAEFVAFLDADDLWDPGKLEAQVAYLDAHPHVVGVGCFMRYVSATGRILGRTGQPVSEPELLLIARGELFPFPTSSLVVRRSAFDALGGFDESFRHAGAEDIELYARLARRGGLACVPEVLGSYRIHPKSAMARERLRINREAEFVRRRLAAREVGSDLTWQEFTASHRPSWGARWQGAVEVCYRAAALHHAEGRAVRAVACCALALLLGPRYTLRRLRRQRRPAS
ncbi:MAG: glycosyltransferase family 2 protein [Gemmatimonadales bacterium]